MCEWGTETVVAVWVPARLSHTGQGRWKRVAVDSCIADIVSALQVSGIVTTGCCCGHGEAPGEIRLEDGRRIVVAPSEDARPPTALVGNNRPGGLSRFWDFA